MYKKNLLVVIILAMYSCTSTKPMIVTQKKAGQVVAPYQNNNEKSVVKYDEVEIPKDQVETIVSTSKTVVTSDIINGYVYSYKDIAMENMKVYKIPASIILAQGILESGAGQGDLSHMANNHFGIKCHLDWTGETVKHDDDAAQECFRKYNEPAESYKDHASFLTTKPRYKKLFDLDPSDYKAWALGLKAAGYATDPRYPDKLISYIERFNLQQYDNQVLGKEFVANESQMAPAKIILQEANPDLYEVQKGDTFYSVSKKFNVTVEELKQKNGILDNVLSIGQKLIVK